MQTEPIERTPDNNKVVIIDGNSLINRAYYAIQRPMITKDGLYTQGVYGFLNMLAKVRKDYQPAYLVVAFDRKAPTFRHEEYSEYKANRKKMPMELAMQMPLLKEVLEAMNVKMMEIDGFEADDILGTVARKAEVKGLDTLIITGDKDALQLVSPKTKVVITKKGISWLEEYDESSFFDEYGFKPDQFIDYKALMGDSSDNIPGIPGVGEKTAQKLIVEFGSVGNLLANVDKIKNEKLRIRVEENVQLALLSRRLAEINTEVPLPVNFEEFMDEEADNDKLIEIYRKLEFNSFLKKMKTAPEIKQEIKTEPSRLEPTLTRVHGKKDKAIHAKVIIDGMDDLGKLEQDLKKNPSIVMKVVHDGSHIAYPEIYGIGLLTKENFYYVGGQRKELFSHIKTLLIDYKTSILGHGLKDDYYALLCNGFTDWEPVTAFDTSIGQYLLEPERGGYDLSSMLITYLHKELGQCGEGEEKPQVDLQMSFMSEVDVEDNEEKAFKWCVSVEELTDCVRSRIEEEELWRLLEEVELPLIFTLAAMEAEGFALDRQVLLDIGKTLTDKIEIIKKEIHRLAGEEFNVNSPKQLGVILFEKLGLPVGKKTKTGYSTNAEILEKLRGKHEIIDHVMEYRGLAKLNSTYVEGLLPLIHSDGKIHAHFQQTITSTGRISCTEPNLQNIPIRQELGRLIRKAFITRDDSYILMGADYSQIELRVLAHMSKDPALIDAFERGDDIHKITAARILGVPEDEVTSHQRSSAKAVNFGVIYGMSGFGLASELQISRKEAEGYIEEYFRNHTKVREFMDNMIMQADEKGYVTTIMGRKRPIPEIQAANRNVRQLGERLAMNSPIQGSAADIIKLAMIKCYKRLKQEGLKSRLILQVHDELIIETLKDEEEQVKKLLKETMEQAVVLDVPISVDLNTGKNWYELK